MVLSVENDKNVHFGIFGGPKNRLILKNFHKIIKVSEGLKFQKFQNLQKY